MNLAGVDIGFSERRRSNGIAVLRDGKLECALLGVQERDAALRELSNVEVIAIDAPLLPAGSPDTLVRECERAFSRGPFQRRCKPGMSHIRGTGRTLRAHGTRAADQSPPDVKVVEAFPNAFLGVALPDEDFRDLKIRRGKKFDWLYERWLERGLFRTFAPQIASACETERNHDLRAALVCLMTALFAATDNCFMVGDEVGGYFCLPPLHLWAEWARGKLAPHEDHPRRREEDRRSRPSRL